MTQGKKVSVDPSVLETLTSQFSDTQIAKQLNLAVSTVFSLRKKHGIRSFTEKTKSRQGRLTGEILLPGEGVPHKDLNSPESLYFAEINTPRKAYFLGLIATDGSLSYAEDKYLSVELKDPDYCVLETLAEELQSVSKVAVYSREDKNNTKYGRLRVYNRVLVDCLKRLGITDNTTKNKAYINLSKELRPHYLRGLLDGDGCVKSATKTLNFGSCSRDLVAIWDSWVSEEFGVSCSITEKILKSKKPFYTITFGGKPKEVLSWLYQSNQDVCVPRKLKEASLRLNMKE
jgi:hypothetical protein